VKKVIGAGAGGGGGGGTFKDVKVPLHLIN
jgi:hypothetical protein